jgi:NAD(P)-dependent dehydrogenase (short-subunit alcohol dehydrogenase family)
MTTDPVLSAKPILERFRLNERVALVTGAGQGIGRAYAHALGEAGAAVAIADISAETANNVADELKVKNVDAIAIQVDVTDAAQVHNMVKTVVAKWGTLTIGVNNAGIGQWIAAEEMPEADWDRMLNINLRACFCAVRRRRG